MAKRPQPQTPLRVPKRRKPKRVELEYMYHEQHMTQREIAAAVGYSYAAVKRWFVDYAIPRRSSGWGKQQREETLPAATPAPPKPPATKRRRGSRKPVRPFLRLTSTERGIVQKQVDHFLVWVAMKREMEEA